MRYFLFLMAFTFLIASCAGDTAEKLLDKCNDIKCGEHGDCAIDINDNTVCVCNEGFHADNLECIANEVIVNPCDGIACSGNGDCAVAVNNVAVCICDDDYHAEELACIVDAGSPCEGIITCDTNGACAVDAQNKAVCVCETGFHADTLTCIADDVVVNPCETITSCDTNGICAVDSDNKAICACNTGYHAENVNLTCVRNSTDPCEGITCDGDNDTCVMGECKCDSGYNDDVTAGSCIANTCGTDNHVIETVTGNFYEFVRDYDYLPKVNDDGSLPNPNERYIIPPDTDDDPYVTKFKLAVKYLIKGDICSAEENALLADMKLFKFVDTNSSLDSSLFTNEYICIMGKDEENDVEHDASFYRGLFCMRNYIETNTYTRNIHIAIPHPLYDGNTNIQGAETFSNTGARYFSLATAHRCGNDSGSDCQGTTGVCNRDGDTGTKAFRISDMAHNSDSLFYYFGTQIQDLDTSYHFQIHGFGEDNHVDRVAVVTLGSELVKVKADRMIRKFTDTLNGLINSVDSAREAISCNDGTISDFTIGEDHYIRLCATTNTIGRYINGLVNAGSSCTVEGEAITFAHSRFIHIEQSRWIRGKKYESGVSIQGEDNRFFLVTNTVNQLFPAVLVLESTE